MKYVRRLLSFVKLILLSKWLFTAFLIALFALTIRLYLLSRIKYRTISPEILKRYNREVVKKQKPKIEFITDKHIWKLRKEPDRNVDYIRLKINLDRLSTEQQTLLKGWLNMGRNNLYLVKREMIKYSHLFGIQCIEGNCSPVLVSEHPVNAGVKSISIGREHDFDTRTVYAFRNLPKGITRIVGCKEDPALTVVGAFRYRGRRIVFRGAPIVGTDEERWNLNFNQWLAGYDVPGASRTAGDDVPTKKKYRKR